jgi:hypothetical protein
MASALTLASCSFPTSFETLWQTAALCGVVLIIIASVLFCQSAFSFLDQFYGEQKRSLKHLGRTLLIGATLVGGIWSFALAVVTSQYDNSLVCAGAYAPGLTPGEKAVLVRRAEDSYHTLLAFQAVVNLTIALTIILALIGIWVVFRPYFTGRRVMWWD